MTKQPKALELALGLKRLRLARECNSEANGRMHEAEETIRAQHALIVQMREALHRMDKLRSPFPPSDEEIAVAWRGNDAALAAADQYLGEQK